MKGLHLSSSALFLLVMVLPVYAQDKPADQKKVAGEAGEASPLPERTTSSLGNKERPKEGEGESASRMTGQRTLVDMLDEKAPLEVGVQLRIFKQARQRKNEVDRMEGMLERRALRLETITRDIEKRYRTLRMVQEELSVATEEDVQLPSEVAAEAEEKEAQERAAKVKKLAKVFNSMKAADASKMLPVMDPELAVEVLSRLKAKQAAKILGQVEPELAARLTNDMALAGSQKKKKKRKR